MEKKATEQEKAAVYKYREKRPYLRDRFYYDSMALVSMPYSHLHGYERGRIHFAGENMNFLRIIVICEQQDLAGCCCGRGGPWWSGVNSRAGIRIGYLRHGGCLDVSPRTVYTARTDILVLVQIVSSLLDKSRASGPGQDRTGRDLGMSAPPADWEKHVI